MNFEGNPHLQLSSSRDNNTDVTWYYKLEGTEKWKALPSYASYSLEEIYRLSKIFDKTSGQFFPYRFPPFAPQELWHNCEINFKENIIVVKLLKAEIKRIESFRVPLQRAKWDQECKVESLSSFPNPFKINNKLDPPFTEKEIQIIEVSSTIRETHDWEQKRHDPKIIDKWRSDLDTTSDEVFNYVMEELAYYESLQAGSIKPSGVHGVWQADGLVTEDLRQSFLAEVSNLENMPNDWHPGSNNQVLDLVDPSLFCLVAGISCFTSPAPPFKNIGSGVSVPGNLQDMVNKHNKEELKVLIAELKKDTKGTALYEKARKMTPTHKRNFCERYYIIKSGMEEIDESSKNDATEEADESGGSEIDASDGSGVLVVIVVGIVAIILKTMNSYYQCEQPVGNINIENDIANNINNNSDNNNNKYIYKKYKHNESFSASRFDELIDENYVNLVDRMTEVSRRICEHKINLKENSYISSQYQWIPTDCQINEDGKVSFLSYINNLDPRKHEKLYSILSKILETFVPLYERVLTDLRNPRPLRYQPKPFVFSDEDLLSWVISENESIYNKIPLPPFSPPPLPSHSITLSGRRIQVIVKLENIILTPENPVYEGGEWHVEGMMNEQIVSSGIYYYESENITESRLHFRKGISEPNYEQDDVNSLEEAFAKNQQIGSLEIRSGRSIAYPNLYQTQVAPFQLVDPSKNGFRKILVFYLVDPAIYIPSTQIIPPQQPSWRRDALHKFRPFSSLPTEVMDKIINLSTSMTLEDAKIHREWLVQERKVFVEESTYFEEEEN